MTYTSSCVYRKKVNTFITFLTLIKILFYYTNASLTSHYIKFITAHILSQIKLTKTKNLASDS